MDSTRFDDLTTRLAASLSRRRGLSAATALGLGALLSLDDAGAKKRKKTCPPCKKRKKGKCKANQPDNTICNGGVCVSGQCLPCPASQRLCNGICIASNRCCETSDCPLNGNGRAQICTDGTCHCVADNQPAPGGSCAGVQFCCNSVCKTGVCGSPP